MGREAPLNSHNFNVWSNFEIPVGGDKIIILKFKMALGVNIRSQEPLWRVDVKCQN